MTYDEYLKASEFLQSLLNDEESYKRARKIVDTAGKVSMECFSHCEGLSIFVELLDNKFVCDGRDYADIYADALPENITSADWYNALNLFLLEDISEVLDSLHQDFD